VKLWQARHPWWRQKFGGKLERDAALVAVRRRVCQMLDPAWEAAYERVSKVLRETVRASSVVECMNSVVRMHQARHRGLSQALLDLKRLYWNCRTFAEGKRKKRCPYEHLGLQLPTYDWWELASSHSGIRRLDTFGTVENRRRTFGAANDCCSNRLRRPPHHLRRNSAQKVST
jgi:hypothetical protein